jgi:HK97 family phage major capsid protein
VEPYPRPTAGFGNNRVWDAERTTREDVLVGQYHRKAAEHNKPIARRTIVKTIRELIQRRDALMAELDTVLEPVLTEVEADRRELTSDEETRQAEIEGEVEAIDARVLELDRKEQHNRSIAEARARANTDLSATDMQVTDEPKVYGEGSPNSFVADLVKSSNPGFTGFRAARERMEKYEYQIAVEVARDTEEGKRATGAIREARRSHDSHSFNEAIDELRARGNAGSESGLESRAMSAGSGSGGSFVTPVYFIQEWAPYRTPGRAFIDACNKQAMPDYGMTIYIPAVQSDAGVAVQESAPGTGEGTAVTETDPTTGYLSANLQTEAGQVVVSQQLLDRAGPNFAFDRLIFDQLTRDYNKAADAFTLSAALAGAGQIKYNASAWALTFPWQTTPGGEGVSFYDKVAQAKSVIRTAAGVVMDPTHLFVDPRRFELLETAMDTTGRPLLVPGYANPMNAAAAGNGDGKTGYEGDSGYKLTSLPIYQDLNIPTVSAGFDQAIVGALDEVYVWESSLVPRVIPQTYAQNLQVLLQVYAYIAVIPRYPTAVQSINGSAMALAQF